LFVFPLLMLYAATMDVLTMRIANALSIALVAAFLIVATVAGMSFMQMLMHLGIGVAALLVCMVLFQLRFVGGGDAKLLAAASLWVGYEQFAPFIIWVTVFGGLLAVLMLAYRNMPATALPLPNWALRLHANGTGIPYAVAITAGALMVYPTTGIPQLLGS
jgi:prepilin peptidase CpaA